MIAIDVTMTTKDKTQFNVFEDAWPIASQSRDNVYNFFKNCIDQNIVLNAAVDVEIEDLSKKITRYFATTVENARAFQTAFEDVSAEFSMKKMWTDHGFDISVEQHEVDFEQEYDVYDLISADGNIWGVDFEIFN
jgi:hypothetical protein